MWPAVIHKLGETSPALAATFEGAKPVTLDDEIDLVALEQPSKEALRLFIDHPGGVDLALCERVTLHLNHLRADYSLEVSSPGPKYRNRKEIQ